MATATEEEHVRDKSHSLLISREVVPPTFSGKCVRIEVFKSVNKYRFKFKDRIVCA